MEVTQIIRRPILTEKSNIQQQNNTYTFEVAWNANKFQIKEAIEFIFKVKVAKVNTLKVDKKYKRVGRFEGFENRYKKAIVTLSEGVINFYPNEVEAQDKADKKAKEVAKAKEAEKADAKAKEAKLAEKIAAKKAAKKVDAKSTTTKKASTTTKKVARSGKKEK
ncbi:50S ribosomal protein L23 [Mycoplasmopsis lipofaciens]|uniref:50S ribosomal protein L23 n=1 Tax=Mycoplasmopsis lipofaciens TaxID=114884 RepID=UPI0004828080|nr:50S ribosomal protein L23 [Mycoplasmopsis lipofaciens]